MRDLIWVGDDIGLGDREATVSLRDTAMPKGTWHVGLGEALAVARRIDIYGLYRLETALEHAFEHGYLTSDDAAAWRTYKAGVSRQQRAVSHH